MSSWQIACSLFSPLPFPVEFSFSGALMINGSIQDFLAESHLVCTAASPSDPTPNLNAILSLALPVALAIIPRSLLPCV